METIRLGLLSPLSGIVSLYGSEISMAAKIAVDEINEAGGLLGKKLELIVEDDGSLPESAIPAAFKLIDEHHCCAIIGNLLSNSRIAVSNLVSDVRKIPQLNFSFYEGGINSPYFFHFAALPNQQIDKMIPYMAQRFGTKMFFAGNNYEWPRGSIDAAKAALLDVGGEILDEEYLPIGTSKEEIDSLIDAVSKSGADVFVPYFAGQDQIDLLNAFTEHGLKKKMAVVMGHYDEAMVSMLKPEVREGFLSSNTYFMSIDTEENKNYKKRLLAEPGIDGIWPKGNGILTNFGEGAYLCVKAFAKAVTEAKSIEADALIKALEQVEVNGAQGLVKMDKISHHAHVNTYLSECNEDGSFSIVESFGLNPPKVPKRYEVNSYERLNTASSEVVKKAESTGSLLMNEMFDMVDVAMLSTDYDGIIVDANAVMLEMFGYSYDELVGMSVHMLLPPHLRERHKKHIKEFVQSELRTLRMGQRAEITGYKKDGTYFSAEASILKAEVKGQQLLVATMIDITRSKEHEEKLQWQATHDALTSLANRKLISERLGNALERSKKNGNNVAVLFIDIDNFKLINDTFGHEAGDEILTWIGQSLSKTVGAGDIVGRLGGDEFVIVSEKFEDSSEIADLAKQINHNLRQPFTFNGQEVYTTASIGVAVGHGNTHMAEDMLRDSDAAMYLTKRHGRDNWNLFTDELHQYAKRELEISNGLRAARKNDEFTLLYQPIVAAETGLIKGAEALLRWKSMRLGSVPPDEFITVAEKNGTIIPIGAWVFEQVCKSMRVLEKLYPQNTPYLSVNVSTVQIDDMLYDNFMKIVDKYEVDPHNIVLEITETSIMNDANKSLDILNKFSDKGFLIAVDDFGTGYSSLLQLMRLPISKIKIDKAFIDGLGTKQESRTIVNAIVKMSKALDKKIIAEGVEDKNQLFELQSMQAEYIQGYYFHKPMEINTFMEILGEQLDEGNESYQGIYRLIYVSKEAERFSLEAISGVIKNAKIMNAKRGITSFLIHGENDFAQFIEGSESKVKIHYEKVKQDSRHKDIVTVMEGKVDHRIFNDFTMGFWQVPHIQGDVKENEYKLWNFKDNAQYLLTLFEALKR